MGTVRFTRCAWGFTDSTVNEHSSLRSLFKDFRIWKSMCTDSFAHCAWGFADSKDKGYSSLCSLCVWPYVIGGLWAQLAVLVDLYFRVLIGTARFARCACGFVYLAVNRHTSFRSLCLLTCVFGGQLTQLASFAVLGDLWIRQSMSTARFAPCACGFLYSRVNRHNLF